MAEGNLDAFACPNKDCPDRGKHGKGNLRKYDTYGTQGWRRLKCATCKKTFSERRGTPMFRIHISEEKVAMILTLLSRGGSLRGTAEGVGVDQNTVINLLKLAGEHAKAFHDHMVQNLKVTQAQADEIFTFVKKRLATPRRTAKR